MTLHQTTSSTRPAGAARALDRPVEEGVQCNASCHNRTRAVQQTTCTGCTTYDHLVWPGTHHSRNGIYGTWGRWLFRHDVGDSNHLGPFLRFNCDISAELPGGENHRYGSDLGEL